MIFRKTAAGRCSVTTILDICHKHHKRCLWRKNLPCGEISPHDRLSCAENLHSTNCQLAKCLHMVNVETNLSFGEISPHQKCGDNLFCLNLCCFVSKSVCVAIYAVLSRNQFCRDLRVFAWRKIQAKIVFVEKKGQISGMDTPNIGIFYIIPLGQILTGRLDLSFKTIL